MVYPQAEVYYNKIGLSGFSNEHNLELNNLNINMENVEGKKVIKIDANIYNKGILPSNVPEIMIEGKKEKYKAQRTFLKAKEKTSVTIKVPVNENEELLSVRLKFVK